MGGDLSPLEPVAEQRSEGSRGQRWAGRQHLMQDLSGGWNEDSRCELRIC